MKRQENMGRRPRVRPQMNTDTRRHAEKQAYHRHSKYREELLEDEMLQPAPEDDGGVLSDYAEPPEEAGPATESGTQPGPEPGSGPKPGPNRGRRKGAH